MGAVFKEVSVVVSTYTAERIGYVLACIQSLKRQTLPAKEIILALDSSKTLLQFYESHTPTDVKIVVSEGYGLSNARNAGVRNAVGEIIAFVDDDAIMDDEWLEILVKNYDDPHVVGVAGLIKPLWENGRPFWFPDELNWIVGCSYKGLPESRASVRNPIGCNMSFRTGVFEKVGFFKSNIGRFGKKLLGSEETELSIRVTKKIPNSKIIYDPSAVVYHRVNKRANVRYLWKRSFYEGVSKALITSSEKNPSKILFTEYRYLRYLLEVATLSRFKQLYRLENMSQLLVLLTSTFLVLAGYLVGRLISDFRKAYM